LQRVDEARQEAVTLAGDHDGIVGELRLHGTPSQWRPVL
jgi:hypothetical protein